MNETGEIMSTQNLSPEVPTVSNKDVTPTASKANVIDAVKPAQYDVNEKPATAEDVKNSAPFSTYEQLLRKQDALPEETPEEVRQELRELTEKTREDLDEEGEPKEKTASEKESANDRLEKKEKKLKIIIDAATQLAKILLVIKAIIKLYLLRTLLNPSASDTDKVSGKEIALPNEPLEGKDNERLAIRFGLKKKKWKDQLNEFKAKEGTQAEMIAEATKIFGAENTYRLEKDDAGGMMKKPSGMAGLRDRARSMVSGGKKKG